LTRQAGIHPHPLLLDHGFESRTVIRYRYRARYPFVMPVVRRGRAANDPRGPSVWHTSTLINADKHTATVPILTCTAVTGKGSADGRGAKP
jgi:hypothetical protein